MAQKTITVVQGQTIFDIVNQEYGDCNYVNDFLVLNGFSINHNPLPGDVVLVDTDNVGNERVKDFYSRVGTSGNKKNVPTNYTDYLARDFSATNFNTNDFS